MLVIDRVELVFVDKPLKMWELERDHTVRGEKMRHPCGEVVEIGDLRQHIVAYDEVGPPTLGLKALGALRAEKLNESWNTFLARGFGDIGGRLDADHRDAHGQEML